MNLAFLASFIALILVVAVRIRQQNKQQKKQQADFWEREHRANTIRRKPLDGLKYIQIPLETFPTHLLQDNEQVLECIGIVEALTSQKIVNLTGYSNTDLKLEYGTANITDLSEYDQNYTVLVRTLQKWADLLTAAGYQEEAVILMEFAVQTGTDISSTYYQLADYYASKGEMDKISYLSAAALTLRSANRTPIVKHLQSQYPDA